MNIADFLEVASDEILAESIAYAKTILSLKDEEEAVLRDHLPKVLEAISADLRTSQTRAESIRKSHGLAPAFDGETAAQTHGLSRALSGLHIDQVIAEYRALRSCVLRLWSEAAPSATDALQDATRFNEAIDQALAESVAVYAVEVDRWQQIFLAVLGHDLRSPLNAIALTSEVLVRTQPKDLATPAAILRGSAKRMTSLLDSLLEYNRAGLGSGMILERLPIDLEAECREEVDLQLAAVSGARIEIVAQGDTRGEFDASRVREALGNLISNAVKHGLPADPVRVKLQGSDDAVQLEVDNAVDQEIPANELEQLFEPLRRGALQRLGADRAHLGLGLFIVRQIAKAHGGTVVGSSSSRRVRFTMTLPKTAPGRPRD